MSPRLINGPTSLCRGVPGGNGFDRNDSKPCRMYAVAVINLIGWVAPLNYSIFILKKIIPWPKHRNTAILAFYHVFRCWTLEFQNLSDYHWPGEEGLSLWIHTVNANATYTSFTGSGSCPVPDHVILTCKLHISGKLWKQIFGMFMSYYDSSLCVWKLVF